MFIKWFKRKLCEWFDCIGPGNLPFRVTNEDADGQCIEWECPRCGETVHCLRMSKSFMKMSSKRIHEIRSEKNSAPLDGEFVEVAPQNTVGE